MSNKKYIVAYLALLVLIFPKQAHAYLDPGTGSYVLQIVAALFFAGAFVVKGFWHQIKDFTTKTIRKDKKSESSNHKDN